jgi:hypothetical protein
MMTLSSERNTQAESNTAPGNQELYQHTKQKPPFHAYMRTSGKGRNMPSKRYEKLAVHASPLGKLILSRMAVRRNTMVSLAEVLQIHTSTLHKVIRGERDLLMLQHVLVAAQLDIALNEYIEALLAWYAQRMKHTSLLPTDIQVHVLLWVSVLPHLPRTDLTTFGLNGD